MTWEATITRLSVPETIAAIVTDEETLFERMRKRLFLLDEHESNLR